jgi:hypothetical protein
VRDAILWELDIPSSEDIVTVAEIAELLRLDQQIVRISTLDPLSGLPDYAD